MREIYLTAVFLLQPCTPFPSKVFYGLEDTTRKFLDFDSCNEPLLFWPGDGKCYTIGQRGPCEEGEILIFSRVSFRPKCSGVSKTSAAAAAGTSKSSEVESENSHASCNGKEKIFWEADGKCYMLLEQGPCQENQWLVLASLDPPTAKCSDIPCKDPKSQAFWPRLCQCVDTNNTIRSGRYSPAEICGSNTRIVTDPYGQGMCACESGFYMDQEGNCHALGSQGPCDPGLIWELVGSKLTCLAPTVQLKNRVFDLVHHDQQRAQVVRCYQDSKGNCRKPLGLNIGRFQGAGFNSWLKEFEQPAKTCEPKQCDGDKLLWTDGQCYQAATTGPCKGVNWLVLDQIIDDRPVLRCKENKCTGGVWWQPSCSCVETEQPSLQGVIEKRTSLKLGDNPCPGLGFKVLINPYGGGLCGCEAGFRLTQNGDECLPIQVKAAAGEGIDISSSSRLATRSNCSPLNESSVVCASSNEESKASGIDALMEWLASFAPPNTGDCGSQDTLRFNPLTQEDCSKTERVLYNGECHDLLSTSPCNNNTEWLVMTVTEGQLAPACKPRVCAPGDVMVANQQTCECMEPKTGAVKVCADNEILRVGIFGEGVCGCKDGYRVSQADGYCHPDTVHIPEVKATEKEEDASNESAENSSESSEASDKAGGSRESSEGLEDSSESATDDSKESSEDFDSSSESNEKKSSAAVDASSGEDESKEEGSEEESKEWDSNEASDDGPDNKASGEEEGDDDSNETSGESIDVAVENANPLNCQVDTRGRCRRGTHKVALDYSDWLNSFQAWIPTTCSQ